MEESDNDYSLASRADRFWAVMLDGVLAVIVTLPLFLYFDIFDAMKESESSLPSSYLIGINIISFTLFMLMHGYLLNKYGQTIGKHLLKIKIVTLNNELPDIKSLILLRYVPLWLSGLIPIVGSLIPTADALFIFRGNRRCIHDLIAGTMVVDVSANKALNSDAEKARSFPQF